jgi:hypothetical protein
MLPAVASVTTDSLSQYPHVPLFYICSRNITPAQEQNVHDAIRITRIWFAIITDVNDTALAQRFTSTVLQVADVTAARATAHELYNQSQTHDNRSVIITQQDNILTAVYEDHEAPINVSAT